MNILAALLLLAPLDAPPRFAPADAPPAFAAGEPAPQFAPVRAAAVYLPPPAYAPPPVVYQQYPQYQPTVQYLRPQAVQSQPCYGPQCQPQPQYQAAPRRGWLFR